MFICVLLVKLKAGVGNPIAYLYIYIYNKHGIAMECNGHIYHQADVFLPWEDRLEREYDLELIVTAPSDPRKKS